MDITRSVRDAGSQAPSYLQVQELHLEDSGDAHYLWSSTKHHIFPAHQNHLNTSKIPMPGAHPRDSRVISLGCGPAQGFFKSSLRDSNVQDEMVRKAILPEGKRRG